MRFRLALVLLAVSALDLSSCRTRFRGAPAPATPPAPTTVPAPAAADAVHVSIEARVLEATPDRIRALGIYDGPIGSTSLRLLNADERRSLEERLAADGSVREVATLRLRSPSGQEARESARQSEWIRLDLVARPSVAPGGRDVEFLDLHVQESDTRHHERYIQVRDVTVPDSRTLLLAGSSIYHPDEGRIVLLTARVVRSSP